MKSVQMSIKIAHSKKLLSLIANIILKQKIKQDQKKAYALC